MASNYKASIPYSDIRGKIHIFDSKEGIEPLVTYLFKAKERNLLSNWRHSMCYFIKIFLH